MSPELSKAPAPALMRPVMVGAYHACESPFRDFRFFGRLDPHISCGRAQRSISGGLCRSDARGIRANPAQQCNRPLEQGDRLRIRSVEPQIELAELTAVIARA